MENRFLDGISVGADQTVLKDRNASQISDDGEGSSQVACSAVIERKDSPRAGKSANEDQLSPPPRIFGGFLKGYWEVLEE